jgi:hypothetical protein
MNKFVIKEEFFGFTELLSNTSLIIKDVILKQIDAFVLNMTNLWGQGYDGGSNMSGMLLLGTNARMQLKNKN